MNNITRLVEGLSYLFQNLDELSAVVNGEARQLEVDLALV